jgi:type VI protein secretion system component VasK
MQPFIGPPIPIHLLATTSGWMRLFVVALIAVSLVVHIVFLVRVSRFLNRWGKRLDEQQRQREERDRKLDEQERESEQRHAESMKQLHALAAVVNPHWREGEPLGGGQPMIHTPPLSSHPSSPCR